jgi:hypothetical protein
MLLREVISVYCDGLRNTFIHNVGRMRSGRMLEQVVYAVLSLCVKCLKDAKYSYK